MLFTSGTIADSLNSIKYLGTTSKWLPLLNKRHDYYQKLPLKLGMRLILIASSTNKKRHTYCCGDIVILKEIGERVLTVASILDTSVVWHIPRDAKTISLSAGGGARVQIVRRQFPVLPAYCLTVHRVQGKTLKEVHVWASKAWEGGQVYVALSRVRLFTDLYIHELDLDTWGGIKVDGPTLRAYKSMQAQAGK